MRTTIAIIIMTLISFAFIVARFVMPFESVVHKADIFKDMAHIWVGLLAGIGVGINIAASWGRAKRWYYLALALGIMEVAAFLFHMQ